MREHTSVHVVLNGDLSPVVGRPAVPRCCLGAGLVSCPDRHFCVAGRNPRSWVAG